MKRLYFVGQPHDPCVPYLIPTLLRLSALDTPINTAHCILSTRQKQRLISSQSGGF